jgi:hypothetical protein
VVDCCVVVVVTLPETVPLPVAPTTVCCWGESEDDDETG